jgi:hypothetical protein
MNRLNQAVKRRSSDRIGLEGALQNLKRIFQILDSAPRHDTEFSEDEADKLTLQACGPYAGAFQAGISKIEAAIAELREGVQAIEGVFGGELRATLDEPLRRRLEELEILQGKFTVAWMKHRRPTKPFELRQQNLITIILRLNPELEDVVSLRACFPVGKIGSESHQRLCDAEQRLRRIRSQMAKCRDNPSQKMGRQAVFWCDEYTAVRCLLESVRCKAMYDHLRAGGTYGSRNTYVTAMWLPSMEGADPWTFDPFPYMEHASPAEKELILARCQEIGDAQRRANAVSATLL